MSGKTKQSEMDRFMSHVHKHDSGCWLWTAYCMKSGYGNFRTPLKHELSHRTSYRLFNGQLDTRDVMHQCDTPRCVNPDHLVLGTRLENMQDAKSKKRMSTGERHGRSKLTNQQVEFIRKSNKLQREIAVEFGITQSHVSCLKNGKKWQNRKLELGTTQEGNYYF
jgi:predicted XRE-type DNA-binding protein